MKAQSNKTACADVIVIEDDEAVRDSLQVLLQAAGLSSVVYSSAEEFLASPETPKYACALLDLHLPGLDGFEVLRILSKRQPDCAAIVITGQPDAFTRDRALEAGAVALLEKPLRERVLLDTIQKALTEAGKSLAC